MPKTKAEKIIAEMENMRQCVKTINKEELSEEEKVEYKVVLKSCLDVLDDLGKQLDEEQQRRANIKENEDGKSNS